MFPSFLRLNLRENPDFFRVARIQKSNEILFYFVPHAEKPHIRMAVVVPKRVGNAVQRAKIKRQARAAAVSLQKENTELFSVPYNVVIFFRHQPGSYLKIKKRIFEFLMQLSQENAR